MAANRADIKQQLAAFYDFFWEICDKERFYDLELHKLPLQSDFDQLILSSGTTSLIFAYKDFIFMLSHSVASHNLAQQIEDTSLANYFMFSERNIYAKCALLLYFRYLDHLAFHFNELSKGNLFQDDIKRVYFSKLELMIKKKTGVSDTILKGAQIALESAYDGFSVELVKWLNDQRNAEIHRFSLGIDHIAYPVSRGLNNIRPSERGGLLFSYHDCFGKCINVYGGPDVRFEDFGAILLQMGRNAKKIFNELSRMGCLAYADDEKIMEIAFEPLKNWLKADSSSKQ